MANHQLWPMKGPVLGAHVVVMAKPAIPGRVKTRLIGAFSPQAAAQVHAAMLECVLQRAAAHICLDREGVYILALDGSLRPPALAPTWVGEGNLAVWRTIDQGDGGLGQRLTRVWQAIGQGPVIFLGADSPDVPVEVLGSILPALQRADVAVGPVRDGGYWTLAARVFEPRLLTGIDWGTPNVYHQTFKAAKQAGLCPHVLTSWEDVDQPADLTALRQRIIDTADPILTRLREKLDQIIQDSHS